MPATHVVNLAQPWDITRSGCLGEPVLVLPVADDQCALALALRHHELEPEIRWIRRDERGRPVIVLPRRHLALPLAETERCCDAIAGGHVDVTQLLADIVRG